VTDTAKKPGEVWVSLKAEGLLTLLEARMASKPRPSTAARGQLGTAITKAVVTAAATLPSGSYAGHLLLPPLTSSVPAKAGIAQAASEGALSLSKGTFAKGTTVPRNSAAPLIPSPAADHPILPAMFEMTFLPGDDWSFEVRPWEPSVGSATAEADLHASPTAAPEGHPEGASEAGRSLEGCVGRGDPVVPAADHLSDGDKVESRERVRDESVWDLMALLPPG